MTTARVGYRQALHAALSNDSGLEGVQVEKYWPGDTIESEAIVLGETRGEMSVDVFTGQPSQTQPLTYDDRFTLKLYIGVGQKSDADTAEERGAELLLAVLRVLREDPTNGDTKETGWHLIDVTVGEVVTGGIVLRKEGAGQGIEVDINVHARYFGPAE